MKEKPQKAQKSSKGKKDKAEPIPEAELTPKQLKEKRRQEAQARAAETRKIVTAGVGQWTGKLPAQLLNEHAQKMKWERVEYPTKSFGKEPDLHWVASVILARKNPKTKEVERVRFDPPVERVPKQPTQVEARNLAATYGMHRVLSHRNMKMMLPPMHRDLWAQLDEDKAAAKEHESYKWSEDPWQARKDRDEARQKFETDRKARDERREQNRIQLEAQREAEAESSAKDSHDSGADASSKFAESGDSIKRPFKVKFNNTLAMSRKIRAVVEKAVRENHGFQFSKQHGFNKAKDAEKYNQLSTMLQKLGFAEPFVKEALEYTSTLSTALTWLLIHLPEEDVPKKFTPSDIGFTARVSSTMKIETVTSRLREFGYSEDVARNIAESTHGDLPRSVIALTHSFAHPGKLASEEVTTISQGKQEEDIWPEEIESLSAMLSTGQIKVNAENVSVAIESKKAGARFTFFRPPGYPHVLPGIAVEATTNFNNVSKVVQLEATRRAAVYCHSSLLGDYMLMPLFEHMEEAFRDTLKRPVQLAKIATGVFGMDESQKALDSTNTVSQAFKGTKRTRKALTFNSDQVIGAREKRMSTTEGKEMLKARSSLPAWEKRKEIANLVSKHQIVLITGETGSGKSTQAVQFILDEFPTSQIICTQPRRISAIGVAQRVAEERLVQIGDQVGYVIKGEAKTGSQTQIRFVTSGVLIRMLQQGASSEPSTDDAENHDIGLSGVTHIVVDEVHERSLDGDFLLILLKRIVQKAPQVKIILMSATVDPKQFFNYFAPMDVGYTHIPGRTFPVKQHFLDDIIRETGYRPTPKTSKYGRGSDDLDDDDDDDDTATPPASTTLEKTEIGKIIISIKANTPGTVDYNLVAATVEHIHRKLSSEGDSQGSILVFLSGAAEIDQALRAIAKTPVGNSLWPLPLHAALPPAEQTKVFKKAPRGLRKVVASTNVAETSITISDIVAVVDSGRVKETVYDPEANVTRLVDTFVSQASATQRMGRAGRVRAGECYKLYTENVQTTKMAPRPTPEILRSPLEVLYLNVKAMGISNVEKFLSMAIDPPQSTAMETARQNLIAYGALDPIENSLTALGKHISTIPTDPRTAKLLVLGAMMGCLSTCLTVAAILSIGKLPFVMNRNDDEGLQNLKAAFGGENGDLLAGCEAFTQFQNGTVDRKLVVTGVCRDIRSARRQLLSSLVQIGFVDPAAVKGSSEDLPEDLRKYDTDFATVRAVIGAALQPHTAEIVFPPQKYMSTSAGAIQKEGVDDSRQIKFFSHTGERVFAHPRSLLFGATSFINSARYVSYGGAVMTSKHFVTDLTPLSNYGLILFASRIGVDPLGNGLVIDKWTGFKCWPRAGILLQFLQQLFGTLMDVKFNNPSANVIDHPVIQLVHDLIESEGRAQGIGMVA